MRDRSCLLRACTSFKQLVASHFFRNSPTNAARQVPEHAAPVARALRELDAS